ncbi:Uroporphyrinogen decarboxylase [Labeo rohita]|uniref:Uroporphyrinogen decarboxylase n=1 Tax=Labeo rohita TaxID=84645 RepID=A0ABQ8MXV3_LABRO|nr:Uroporphyrinogen decarboxylase [Labeo rohita]
MRGLLFLLSALFLLESTKGNGKMEYDKLNEHERKIVDRAIEQANKDHRIGKHLDYYKIDQKGDAVIVTLKPTSCNSTTPSVHQKDCKTEDKRRQFSCIDCKGKMEPCLLRRQVEEIQNRVNKCLNPPSVKSHRPGESHMLFQKGENEPQLTGCLGCI